MSKWDSDVEDYFVALIEEKFKSREYPFLLSIHDVGRFFTFYHRKIDSEDVCSFLTGLAEKHGWDVAMRDDFKYSGYYIFDISHET